MEYRAKNRLNNKQAAMSAITLSIVLFSFFACGTKHPAAAEKNSSQVPAKKITVSGNVTQTYSYCGGARPSQDMLEQLAVPKPYPNKKFLVIKGDKNTAAHEIIVSFSADSAGNFSFQLPPGTYSILTDEQAKPVSAADYKTQFITVDEQCLKDWWAKPYYLLEVGAANIKDLKFNFYHRCFIASDIPCLQYDGPMPP